MRPDYDNMTPDELEHYILTGEVKMHKKVDDAKVMELYNEGKNDPEIAKVFGVHQSAIGAWRRDRGLPSQKNMKNKPAEEAPAKMPTPTPEAPAAEPRILYVPDPKALDILRAIRDVLNGNDIKVQITQLQVIKEIMKTEENENI